MALPSKASSILQSVRRHRLLASAGMFMLALLLAAPVLAASLDARLNRTEIYPGDTVTLSLTASGDSQGSPDLNPLRKNFDVLGQSQATSIRIINGRTSSTHTWQVDLLPRHEGDIPIPSLHMNTLSSQRLILKVLPASAARTSGTGQRNQPVLMEIHASPNDPYVQAQIDYRVRILSRVPLGEASLTEPAAGDAIVKPLGDDARYTTRHNGIEWQVIERHYAIFPQHSGKLDITSPVLSANLPVGSRQNTQRRMLGRSPLADLQILMGGSAFPGINSLFEETRPVRIRDHDISIEVKTQPAAAKGGQWLPAKQLTLTERWSPQSPQFRVGDPVTRSITLTATGLSAAQLPGSLPISLPNGVKNYPDQAHTESHTEGNNLVVTKTFTSALIPTASGKLVLPAVTVPWWDTSTNELRTASLPAHTINVIASATNNQAPAPGHGSADQSVTGTASPGVDLATGTGTNEETPGLARPMNSIKLKSWLGIGIGLIAVLLTVLIVIISRLNRTQRISGTAEQNPAPHSTTLISNRGRLTKARSRLQQACKNNDIKSAREVLLDWAAACWPETSTHGLSALARRFDEPEAQQIIAALDRALYDLNARQRWQGANAWPVLEKALRSAQQHSLEKTSTDRVALPDLYPQHG